MINSIPIQIDSLKMRIFVTIYETAGEQIHRILTKLVTESKDYAHRHMMLKGALVCTEIATGYETICNVGDVWPSRGLDGDRLDFHAMVDNSILFCARAIAESGYRVDHSEELFAEAASVSCSGCVAVVLPVMGEAMVTVCEAEKEISVPAGSKLVKFYPVPI